MTPKPVAGLTSVVVATALNPEAVERVARLLAENTAEPYELIVVDTSPHAVGCVHSYNLGFQRASGDVLVAMNDDCQPQGGWLTPLLTAIRNGVSLTSPGWRMARLAGHCLVLPRATWELVGPFDERYRHWNADHHLEMLAIDAGLRIGQVQTSVVLHSPEDPLRTHYRKSMLLGNHAELPNTGQWYLEDQAVYESIWGERRVMDHWPETYEGWCVQ